MEWISSYRLQAEIHGRRRLERSSGLGNRQPGTRGYLAYILGLLISIAVVMATETGEPAQAAKIHRKKGLAVNLEHWSRWLARCAALVYSK